MVSSLLVFRGSSKKLSKISFFADYILEERELKDKL